MLVKTVTDLDYRYCLYYSAFAAGTATSGAGLLLKLCLHDQSRGLQAVFAPHATYSTTPLTNITTPNSDSFCLAKRIGLCSRRRPSRRRRAASFLGAGCDCFGRIAGLRSIARVGGWWSWSWC